jgi:hypothetical protein
MVALSSVDRGFEVRVEHPIFELTTSLAFVEIPKTSRFRCMTLRPLKSTVFSLYSTVHTISAFFGLDSKNDDLGGIRPPLAVLLRVEHSVDDLNEDLESSR